MNEHFYSKIEENRPSLVRDINGAVNLANLIFSSRRSKGEIILYYGGECLTRETSGYVALDVEVSSGRNIARLNGNPFVDINGLPFEKIKHMLNKNPYAIIAMDKAAVMDLHSYNASFNRFDERYIRNHEGVAIVKD